MEKPLLILSVLSITIYALKLFDIENTDLIYTAVTVIIVLSALFLNVKNLKKFIIKKKVKKIDFCLKNRL